MPGTFCSDSAVSTLLSSKSKKIADVETIEVNEAGNFSKNKNIKRIDKPLLIHDKRF